MKRPACCRRNRSIIFAATVVAAVLCSPECGSFAWVPWARTTRERVKIQRSDQFQYDYPSRLSMVASSETSNKASNETSISFSKSSASVSVKAISTKYPTARGSEVDARKIIATGAGRQHLTAVRLSHILLESHDMALSALHELRSNNLTFEDMANLLSACQATRDKGGTLGWISLQQKGENGDEGNDDDDIKNEHLNEIFPSESRRQIVQITTKPGDVVMVESSRGYHLVQVVDVMANVRRMATLKGTNQRQQRLNRNQLKRKLGILGGALEENVGGADWIELTYKVETMGCQMNMADSERIEGQLQSLGLRRLTEEEELKEKKSADLVVLNTCSIRDHAEQKVYSYIGPYAKRKREGEDVTIVVAGCVAQQEGEALLRRAPEVDLVMGPQYANRIGDLLEDVANGNQVVATEATHIMEDPTKPRRQSNVAAWVNVIYGCNERCTFCIVPTTRGIEQSRPVESIVKEVTELVEQGYKEVTLLGQNIDAYGRDMIPKRKFSDLIRTVGAIPGLERLRFVTSHPRYMSLGVVDAVAETPAACEGFHIPFQSGSNEILAAMGRGHTREKYLHIVDRIRSVRLSLF